MRTATHNSNHWLTFLLLPFVSFVSAIKDADKKSAQVLIVVFCGLVGWLMDPGTDQLDVFRYFERFDYISSWSPSIFGANLLEYLSFNSNTKDFYFETVVYLCSRFIPNPHFYYLIFGLVFGVFFSKSLSIILSNFYDNGGKLDYYSGIFLFLIVFAIPFYLIESVRFWTAAWIGIYVALKVFVEKKTRYILWLALALYIHGTYLIYIVLFVLSYFCSRTNKLTYPLVILVYLSVPFSYLSFDAIDSVAQYIPGFLEHTTDVYVEKVYEEQITGTGFSWVASFFDEAVKIFNYLLIVLLTLSRKVNDDKYSRLYIFLLIIIAFANFTFNVPSLGGRYFVVAEPVLYFLCLMTFKDQKYKTFIKTVPYIFSFSIVYLFYYYLPNCIGLFSLFVSPIISFVKFI